MAYLDSYGYSDRYRDDYYDRTGYDSGGYDLGHYRGGHRDYGYGHDYDTPFYEDAYDDALYRDYYSGEDDYYGSYGALLDYEEQLRLMDDISEQERLRRWNERLAFEELEERERLRRYQMMAEEEKIRLGLYGDSWWNSRYGYGRSGVGSGGWRSRYRNRLRPWSSSRLPLSTRLANRFGRMWGAGSVDPSQEVTVQVRRERGRDRLVALEQQLEYAKDRARVDAIAEGERVRMQLEAHRIEDQLERIRLQVQLDEERARGDLRRQELVREAELREDIKQMNEEEHLRRQIDAIGRGYY